jgi:plastocyanin
MLASVLTLALAACSTGSPSAPSGGGPAATPAPASAGGGGSASGGETLQIAAQGIKFSTNELQAPAGQAFDIEFQNDDSGISHSVDILDASGSSLFKGAIFPGVATQTYQVPAIDAGTYRFICDVHPSIMNGTLTVE